MKIQQISLADRIVIDPQAASTLASLGDRQPQFIRAESEFRPGHTVDREKIGLDSIANYRV